MPRLSDLWFRVRALFGGSRMDREFAEEMEFHLEMETRELLRRGASPREARRRAVLALGGVDRYREKARDARGVRPLEDMGRDLHLALRSLGRAPLFTGVVLFVLALGIGSATAIFSVVDGVLFRPLPYPGGERIIRVFDADDRDERGPFAGADYLDLELGSRSVEQLAGYDARNFILVGEEGPERVRGASVTPGFFRVFGVGAALGRTLSPGIEGPGRPATVVLGHGVWQTVFGADPGVVGRTIQLNERPHQVVGVMPPAFDYPGVGLWTSARLQVPDAPVEGGDDPTLDRGAEYIDVVGRLRPGAALEQAQAELGLVFERVVESYPDSHLGERLLLLPLRDSLTEGVRPTLLVLLGAVGILLLTACGNAANLLLARAAARTGEMELRRILGASRRRLLSQTLVESLLLAGAGGVLGALVAVLGTRVLLALAPGEIPRLQDVAADPRFFGLATLLSLGAGVAVGVLPALKALSPEMGEGALLSGSRQSASRGRSRARRALVVAEVAFSLLLLVGGGLMVRTLVALNRVHPGFEPEGTMAASLSLPAARYGGDGAISSFVREVEERLRARPGVESVGTVLSLPIRSSLSGSFYFSIEGRPEGEDEEVAGYQIATPGYFPTLGIPLLQGRLLAETDGPEDPPVVVVNETFREAFFPGEEVLGRRVTWGDPEEEGVVWSTIVGVVGDALQGGLDREPRPEIFNLYAQAPLQHMTVVVRGEGGAASLASSLRGAVREADPSVPLFAVATMEDLLAESLGERRFAMTLLLVFAVVALALAAAGLYGVLRYGVEQRTRELGIRVALGASTGGVVREVLGEGVGLTVLGLAVGAALALPAARLLSDLLFGVGTMDPVTLVLSAVLLLAVALAACTPPALRAARTDPLTALRRE